MCDTEDAVVKMYLCVDMSGGCPLRVVLPHTEVRQSMWGPLGFYAIAKFMVGNSFEVEE